MTLAIGDLRPEEVEAAVALWEACGLTRPWNDPRADIALALGKHTSTVLAGRVDGQVVATAMVGSDGHRGWVYYLAVEPDQRGRGLGRALLTAAEDWLRARAVPKLMLLVRPDNEQVRGFYAAVGYTEEPRVVFSRRLDGK